MNMDAMYSKLFNTYKTESPQTFAVEQKSMQEKLRDMKDVPSIYESFIPYPSMKQEDFNEIIFAKAEFNRYKPTLDTTDFEDVSQKKCGLQNFSLTPNQSFLRGFLSPLTPYNGLLLFHGVGVGKTCTAISIAEQYHDIYQKKVLVILSSTLIDNFKKQIFDITKYDMEKHSSNQCTGLTYPNLVLDKGIIDKDTLERKINRIISEKYQFMGYQQLANLMKTMRQRIEETEIDKEKIEEKFIDRLSDIFSNRLIIIDEAHNLRNPKETGKKQISAAFMTLLKHVKDVKLLLLTATPMFNSAREIAWTLNLLLMNDKRHGITSKHLFDENGDLTEQGKDTLATAARGYVSYMRGENPFSFPFRLYPSINDDANLITEFPEKDIYNKKISIKSKIKFLELVGADMSSIQKKVYDSFKKHIDVQVENDDEEDEEDEEDETPNNELQVSLQVSNIVYPHKEQSINGSMKHTYGDGGLNSCFSVSEKGKYAYKHDVEAKYGQFLNYDSIEKYAPKIKQIIDYIIKSKGIVFVYSRYYSSGIIPMALALEHIGFEKYSSGKHANISSGIDVENKFNGKRPKYVILSRRKNLSPNNDHEIAMAKSQANKHGEIIKVIIVSKVGTEGIDFKRIREIHLLDPWFNLNRTEQIIGRGVRYCSHIDLPKQERNVTIYFHACTYDDDEESIDLRTYRIAENKQKLITDIEQILKEVSIDCNLNKDVLMFHEKKLNTTFDIETSQGTLVKNYKVGDKDFSSACGFMKCKKTFRCNPSVTDDDITLDRSTNDVRFIASDIVLYQRYIAHLYENVGTTFTFKKILKELRKSYHVIDEEILMYALEDMLRHQVAVRDKQDRLGYLIYRGDTYMFQHSKIKDERMTLEERSDKGLYRSVIPIIDIKDTSVLKQQPNVPLVKKIEDHKQPTNDEQLVKTSIMEYIKNELRSKTTFAFKLLSLFFVNKNNVSEVLYLAKNAKQNDEKLLASIIVNDNKEDDASTNASPDVRKLYRKLVQLCMDIKNGILDSIVDRLSQEQFEQLMHHFIQSKEHSELSSNVWDSLLRANIIIVKNEKIMYYYNYFNKDVYCFKPSSLSFKKCTSTDIAMIGDDFEAIAASLQHGLRDTTKSYVSPDKEGVAYKIREKEKSTGFVCHKTSSLKIDELKNMVARKLDVDPPTGLKVLKIELCLLLEILSRVLEPNTFQRPYFVKIEGKKK